MPGRLAGVAVGLGRTQPHSRVGGALKLFAGSSSLAPLDSFSCSKPLPVSTEVEGHSRAPLESLSAPERKAGQLQAGSPGGLPRDCRNALSTVPPLPSAPKLDREGGRDQKATVRPGLSFFFFFF